MVSGGQFKEGQNHSPTKLLPMIHVSVWNGVASEASLYPYVLLARYVLLVVWVFI